MRPATITSTQGHAPTGRAPRCEAGAATPAMPSEEQLRLAFRQLSRPSRWPDTLEAAMADPVFRPCLIQMARTLNRPQWQAQPLTARLPQGQPVPPTPTVPQRPRSETAIPGFFERRSPMPRSGKLAAANDRSAEED